MSEFRGYNGKSLEFLQSHNVKVGDSVKIQSDLTYEGTLMPRYEGSSEERLVLKLRSGYNIGIEVKEISDIVKLQVDEKPITKNDEISTKNGLEKILLLSTGGTIASKIDYRTGAVTPAVTPEELHASVPELSEIANITPKILFSEYSENLQPEHWIKIAEELNNVKDSDYKGIIIAHGTDTMQYTASYLSFALAGFPIPIAMVGSQRSSDRPSSDAALNLIAASRFLTNTDEKGVFVIMHHNENDDAVAVHMGTRVRKNHTSKRGAFQTVGGIPAFLILNEKIQKNISEKFFKQDEYNPRINLDTKVALVKYHPGYDPKILDAIVESGFKAIIFEGTGLGHVGKTMYESIKKANERGIFLGMTSQCIDGRIRMTVYESGRDLLDMGIKPLQNMIPETALVKAMWAAGNAKNIDEINNLMSTNIASEFSD
ncbi:MAG: Glu-tRNA(Gln) amidotransferase subunit GatD [Nitrosopumilaceae archaeon]|nr:Glu-tRNA(Gln) amidotransferase subunit GatD [Nitrosopumilaceae archaeon]